MLTLALLGVWHVHAADYTRQAREQDGVLLEKVWDKDGERAKAFAEAHDLEAVSDLDALLKDDALDGVIICTETADHDTVIAQAAQAGKAIFTEKTLAIGADAAKKLADTIREADVPFVISYPQLTHPATVVAHAALDRGTLGDPVKMRFRNSHGGKAAGWLPAYWYDVETAGGGALMDLGCHPVYIANALFGTPETVSATLSPPSEEVAYADDEATVVLTYRTEPEVQVILETSFMTPESPRLFELYGTKGTLLAVNDEVRLLGVEPQDGIGEDGVVDVEAWCAPVETDDTTVDMPMVAFLSLIEAWKQDPDAPKEIPAYGLDAAVKLADVLERAYVSAAAGKVTKAEAAD